MRIRRLHLTWLCFTSIMSVCFRYDGISHQRLHWGALTSVLIFVFVRMCYRKWCCFLHSIYYVLIAKEGTTHTHKHTHTHTHITDTCGGTDRVYILGCTVLTMGDKGAKGQFIIGQTHTHTHTHQLRTFNQYILVEFCLYSVERLL